MKRGRRKRRNAAADLAISVKVGAFEGKCIPAISPQPATTVTQSFWFFWQSVGNKGSNGFKPLQSFTAKHIRHELFSLEPCNLFLKHNTHNLAFFSMEINLLPATFKDTDWFLKYYWQESPKYRTKWLVKMDIYCCSWLICEHIVTTAVKVVDLNWLRMLTSTSHLLSQMRFADSLQLNSNSKQQKVLFEGIQRIGWNWNWRGFGERREEKEGWRKETPAEWNQGDGRQETGIFIEGETRGIMFSSPTLSLL